MIIKDSSNEKATIYYEFYLEMIHGLIVYNIFSSVLFLPVEKTGIKGSITFQQDIHVSVLTSRFEVKVFDTTKLDIMEVFFGGVLVCIYDWQATWWEKNNVCVNFSCTCRMSKVILYFSYRQYFVTGDRHYNFFTAKVFCGWDYSITSDSTSVLKKKSIYLELAVSMLIINEKGVIPSNTNNTLHVPQRW